MKINFSLKEVKEGKIKLLVPKTNIPSRETVFYNPDAEFVRDISVAAIQVFQKRFGKKIDICDTFSASGITGLRYAKEVSGINSVTLNDKNPLALKLIKKNISRNNLEKKCKVSNKDANLLLQSNLYNVVDIDPYGTPNIYVQTAAHSTKYGGFVAVTATDAGALSGSFPTACLRKYGIKATRKPYYTEVGLRVLLSFVMNSFSKYDKTFRPVLYLVHKHYYRVYGFIEGTMDLNKTMNKYKHVEGVGTIYLGNIKENKFIHEVINELKKRKFKQSSNEINYLNRIIEEIDEPFYYDINKMHLVKVPKVNDVIFKLAERGYRVSRSSMCDSGVKTNAKIVVKNGLLIVE